MPFPLFFLRICQTTVLWTKCCHSSHTTRDESSQLNGSQFVVGTPEKYSGFCFCQKNRDRTHGLAPNWNRPWYKDVVEVLEDGLDVHVGFLDHGLRHGVPGGDQGHHPVCVHVHAQLDSVALQGEGEAIAQHLHGPLHLRETKWVFSFMRVHGKRAEEGRGGNVSAGAKFCSATCWVAESNH